MTCQNVNIQVVLVRRLMDFSSIKSIRCLFECIFLQPTSILTFEISLPKSIKVNHLHFPNFYATFSP